jgi:PAS domain S-box-containing protein
MEDEKKTRKQLIEEVKELRQCVAELKGFEEEIVQARVNQEKFTKAFLQNSIPMGITTLKEGRFVDISNAFLRLMGSKRDEVIGHTSTDLGFITEEQRVIFFNELNKSGRVENLEMEVNTKGGALRQGLFNAVMMSLGNEKYLLTVMTDITDRKRAELALQESEATSRALINAPTDSVLLLDGRGVILDLNKIAAERFAKGRDEMIGTCADSSLPKDIAERRRSLISQIFETGRAVRFEDQRDGIWYDTVAYPISDKDGVVRRLAVIARDITERKQMEEHLNNHRRQLEELVKERTVDLEYKTQMLEDTNTALKVLLRQRDDDRQDLEDRFVSNIKTLILPYVEKMKSDGLDKHLKNCLTIMESNLNELISPFIHNMRQHNFTPKEIMVSSLIKDGKTTKEIAEIMGVGTSAIDSHRNHIRKKLGLNMKSANLQSYLHSFK